MSEAAFAGGMPEPVRVLVVEDSRTDSELICRMLRTNPGVKVAAAAATGRDALLVRNRVRPDVVVLDLQLPDMTGLDVIEELMAFAPLPILVLSAVGGDKTIALEALARGAVEVMGKPEMKTRDAFEHHAAELTRAVRVVSKARVITHPKGRLARQGVPLPGALPLKPVHNDPVPRRHEVPPPVAVANRPPVSARAGTPPAAPQQEIAAVGIAASTGGPQLLSRVLSQLPTSLPVPALVVQHIADGFTHGLVEWLKSTTPLKVQLADDGALPLPGHVYVAPEGMHLEMQRRRLRLRTGDPVSGHCPSADVMLSTLARDLRGRCMAVVLTGMGRDGSAGAKAVHDAGGYVIAQDEATSAVYGMPRVVVELGIAHEVLPDHEIAAAIMRRVGAGSTGHDPKEK